MQSRVSRVLISLLAAVLLGLTAHPGAAQSWRPEGFYLKPQLGLNTYNGDRSGSGLLPGPPGPSTGLEAAYRTRLGGLSGSLGLYFLAGRYPALQYEGPGVPSLNPGELERWRHTLSLVGQLGFAPEARVNPYLRLGAGTTAGVTDGNFRFAFSPLGGVGLDVAITDRVGLFVEATGLLSLPDDQFDWAEGVDSQGADAVAFLGFGVRIDLSAPFTPVRVFTAEGPTRLEVGQEATFTARANEEEATGPVMYRWDFDDGTTATGATVTHRFEQPGNYTLTLTGSNPGSTDRQLLTVTVAAPATAQAQNERTPPAGETRETVVPFPDSLAADEPDRADRAAQREARAEARAEPLSCTEIVDLNATYFEEGSDELNVEGLLAIRENIQVLKQCPDLRVQLTAYAAPDEPRELAVARARTVEQLYVQSGIAPIRIVEADLRTPEGEMTTKFNAMNTLRRVDTLPVRPATAGEALADQDLE